MPLTSSFNSPTKENISSLESASSMMHSPKEILKNQDENLTEKIELENNSEQCEEKISVQSEKDTSDCKSDGLALTNRPSNHEFTETEETKFNGVEDQTKQEESKKSEAMLNNVESDNIEFNDMEKNFCKETCDSEGPGSSNSEETGHQPKKQNNKIKEEAQCRMSENKVSEHFENEDMVVDNCGLVTPSMPGRGKKRGRSSGSGSSEVTPEPKKRVILKEEDSKNSKVTHHTHPDFTVPGIPLTLGEGDVGQLGLGEDVMERMRPAVVKLDDKIVQVCAGGMHTVCLTNKGEIITFGCNDESALGRDTSEEGSEMYPAKLNLPYKVIQVSGGDSHTAVLTEDGHVYAWGNFRDANGSMGLTSGGISKDPLEMCPGETVVKIVSGGDHLVCLTNKGEIFTGGCAEQGQLGRVAECFAGRGSRRGVDSILKMGPVRCRKHSSRKHATFSDIWAGQYVTFAKEKESGDIYSWGLNNYFQIGFDDMQNRFIPEWIPSFAAHNKQWTKIQAGQHHTMLLDEEGKVYTIGRAEYGRLGLGEKSGEMKEPTLVTKLSDKIIDIAAGQSVSLALTADGTVYGWGMGTSRQLGTGDEEDVWEPVKMSGKQLETRNVVGLSAGGQHTVLLTIDE
ncbi:regulator of chromosome condensation-like [Mytilus galloprovincialis]|uniref:regulator of chromosome condensation-like n=1 Tax=Mytilus galloprovincialis TaxID=29158 RepID=UPI003F7C27C0